MLPTDLSYVALPALLIFWAVGAYNRLVRLKNIIGNAFGQIDVQLKLRYDLITDLVEDSKKYLQHEQSTLEAVMLTRNRAKSACDAMRKKPTQAAAVVALAAAEQALDGSLGRLFAVADAGPEIKADQTIRDLIEELTSIENKFAFARQAYNDAVLDYNKAQRQLPALVIASLFGLAPSAMLRTTGGVAERESVVVQL